MAETRPRRAGRGLCCDGHTSGPMVGWWPRPRRPRTSSSTRRRGPGPSGATCSAPTTATSLPRRSWSARRRTSTARWPPTASWPRRARRAPPPYAWSCPPPRTPGWSASGRSVVEVVTDDMPFLVDSVTMELNRLGHNVHGVIHPQFSVERDITGALREVALLDDDGRPVELGVAGGVVDARRDRPHGRRRGRRHRGGRAAGAARRARVGGGLGEDARPGAGRRRRARGQPAAAPGGRAGPGPRVPHLAGRRPLHLPGLPGVPARGRRGLARGLRPARRSPAPASASCATTRTCRAPSPSCRRW